jgi:hypothetical protein
MSDRIALGQFDVSVGKTLDVEIQWPGLTIPAGLHPTELRSLPNPWTSDDFKLVVREADESDDPQGEVK